MVATLTTVDSGLQVSLAQSGSESAYVKIVQIILIQYIDYMKYSHWVF